MPEIVPAEPPTGGDAADDAVRILFLYFYNRKRRGEDIRKELTRLTSYQDQVVRNFVGNFTKTNGSIDTQNVHLSNVARRLIYLYCENGEALPSYMQDVFHEAFDGERLRIPALFQNDPSKKSSDMDRYVGRYYAFRYSTKDLDEVGPHYIRYYISISRKKSKNSDGLAFHLFYRTRNHTKDNSDSYEDVIGTIIMRQDKMYFLAAEGSRSNLIYIVIPFSQSFKNGDQATGIIVTQNRDGPMIAARITLVSSNDDSEEIMITSIGVYEISSASDDLAKILGRVVNRTDNTYVLRWNN